MTRILLRITLSLGIAVLVSSLVLRQSYRDWRAAQ